MTFEALGFLLRFSHPIVTKRQVDVGAPVLFSSQPGCVGTR